MKGKKLKEWVATHKKLLLIVAAVIVVVAIGVVAFFAIRQAVISNEIKAQIEGKSFMYVDAPVESAHHELYYIKFEDGKLYRVRHTQDDKYSTQYGNMKTPVDYRIKAGVNGAVWLEYFDEESDRWSIVAHFAKNENGTYDLWEYARKEGSKFEEAERRDYGTAAQQFLCSHENTVARPVEGLKCGSEGETRKTCLDCRRKWTGKYIAAHKYTRGICDYCNDTSPLSAMVTAQDFFDENPGWLSGMRWVADTEELKQWSDTGSVTNCNKFLSVGNGMLTYKDYDTVITYTEQKTTGGSAFVMVDSKKYYGWRTVLEYGLTPLSEYGLALTADELIAMFNNQSTLSGGIRSLETTKYGVKYSMLQYSNGELIFTAFLV